MLRRDLILRTLGILGAAPLVTSTVLKAGVSRQDKLQQSKSQQIPDLKPGGAFDRFVADLAAKDEFSGTLLLIHQGRTVLSRSYGWANKELGLPNGAGTIFAHASLTKLFTAVAIIQLVEQGKVKIEAKLGAYLDGFPAEVAEQVTIHHLLTHSSGLGDYKQLPGYQELASMWNSAEEVMDGTTDFIRESASLSFEPGAGQMYSNSGYHLLGAMVERVSEQTYYDYIREHIYGPAGMADSDFYTRPQWRDDQRIARPYNMTPSGERVDIVEDKIFIGTPAGNSFSSCADLERFACALLEGRLLHPAYRQLALSGKAPSQLSGMIQPSRPSGTQQPILEIAQPASPPESFVCYGPIASLVNYQWVYSFHGGSTGESTSIAIYPDREWVVIALSNYDSGTTSPIDEMTRSLITGAEPA